MNAGELPALPIRPPAGHKGDFGSVAVVGGCAAGPQRMIGAPVLSARAALRSGAGLVRLAMPSPIIDAGITLLPSATGLALPVDEDSRIEGHLASAGIDRLVDSCDALAIGPGLGRFPEAGAGVTSATLRAIQQDSIPVVIDADALQALTRIPQLSADFRAAAVLTPHPGEYRTLASALQIKADPVQPAERVNAAELLAQRLGCIVVLKGAGTVVSDGHRNWVCSHGHPCLGTAGTGDVLTGLIAGLAAQHVRLGVPSRGMSLFDAARLGVEIHARAGELWAKNHAASGGLLAEELADLLPEIIESMRADPTQGAGG